MDRGGTNDAATMLRSTFKWAWGKQAEEDQPPRIVIQEREAPQDETREDGGGRESSEREAAESRVDAEPTRKPRKKKIEPKEKECDFDVNPTEVYLSLLKKEWTKTVTRARSHPEEVQTWVSRAEDNGNIRWQLLPIHAAIIFKAPDSVVQALLDAYPASAEQRDDQGMLPLHLAFRNDASEHVVSTLLHSFPGSVTIKDRKGRTPFDMAQASKSAIRDIYMQLLTTVSSLSEASATEVGIEVPTDRKSVV